MNIDATFWVAVSFLIFVGVLFYFKVPHKIYDLLDEMLGASLKYCQISINYISNIISKELRR